jgi:hypothetical protein
MAGASLDGALNRAGAGRRSRPGPIPEPARELARRGGLERASGELVPDPARELGRRVGRRASDDPPDDPAESSVGVVAAVPPTNVCSAPPTIPPLSSLGVLTTCRPANVVSPCRPASRSTEMATTAIVSMTSDARNAASKMEPPALGA